MANPAKETSRADGRARRIWILIAFFALALVPRVYGGLGFGANLDGPGTFRVVNYDESGSCRSIVSGRPYPKFMGHQVLAITRLLGNPPPRSTNDDQVGRRYCHSRDVIEVTRIYSAVTGSLTVVLLGLLALMMWPARPAIAWTACSLLALSNLHIAQSHWGTADSPQVFFILLFTTVLAYGIRSGKRWPLWVSPLLLVAAVWLKWYVFAIFAYVAFLPRIDLRDRRLRIGAVVVVGVGAALAALGWSEIVEFWGRRSYLIWGNESTPFGSGYANIGTWRRWIRNAINLPVVHIVGLGLPACLFVWHGLRRALKDKGNHALWFLHTPALLYGMYMLFLGPVTYYRHYLPLFPAVVLLAAYGLWESRWAQRKAFLAFFLLYPALLSIDSEYDYHRDPRHELRAWFREQPGAVPYITFYVTPPKGARAAGNFSPDLYLRYGQQYIARGSHLILSENWYDTAFPNELNGPIAWKPEWLIKTKPLNVTTYRKILAGEDPNFKLEREIDMMDFMPEFLVHRYFYGSFQLFVGDLKIFRIVRTPSRAP